MFIRKKSLKLAIVAYFNELTRNIAKDWEQHNARERTGSNSAEIRIQRFQSVCIIIWLTITRFLSFVNYPVL
jgi:hypothetical protein